MILMFESEGEFATLEIDREKRELFVSTSKTNYTRTQSPWSGLCDPGKEEEQEKIMDKLNDEEFKNVVIEQMAMYGYKIK